LNAYVDRELPGRERSELSSHLEECEDCRRDLLELEATVALLRRMPEPEPPPAFAASVMARVRAGEAEPQGWLARLEGWLRPAFTVSASAALTGLAVFALARTPAPSGETLVQGPDPAGSEGVALAAAPRAPAAPSTPVLARPPEERAPAIDDRIAQRILRHPRALQLAKSGNTAELGRLLRGAGHPHSASLAAHFEDHGHGESDAFQLIVATSASGRRRR
jgi:anti-sigma factor RsiW